MPSGSETGIRQFVPGSRKLGGTHPVDWPLYRYLVFENSITYLPPSESPISKGPRVTFLNEFEGAGNGADAASVTEASPIEGAGICMSFLAVKSRPASK